MTILDLLAFVLFALSLKLELMEQRRRRARKSRRESVNQAAGLESDNRAAVVCHGNGEAAA